MSGNSKNVSFEQIARPCGMGVPHVAPPPGMLALEFHEQMRLMNGEAIVREPPLDAPASPTPLSPAAVKRRMAMRWKKRR